MALRSIFLDLGQDLRQAPKAADCQWRENPYNALMQAEWGIQKNLVEILANNEVELYATAYMQIYRDSRGGFLNV